jgi:hypothetical protein
MARISSMTSLALFRPEGSVPRVKRGSPPEAMAADPFSPGRLGGRRMQVLSPPPSADILIYIKPADIQLCAMRMSPRSSLSLQRLEMAWPHCWRILNGAAVGYTDFKPVFKFLDGIIITL